MTTNEIKNSDEISVNLKINGKELESLKINDKFMETLVSNEKFVEALTEHVKRADSSATEAGSLVGGVCCNG